MTYTGIFGKWTISKHTLYMSAKVFTVIHANTWTHFPLRNPLLIFSISDFECVCVCVCTFCCPVVDMHPLHHHSFYCHVDSFVFRSIEYSSGFLATMFELIPNHGSSYEYLMWCGKTNGVREKHVTHQTLANCQNTNVVCRAIFIKIRLIIVVVARSFN